MEQPNFLSFVVGFYYLYLKEKYIHKCHFQHNINVTENTFITIKLLFLMFNAFLS